MTVLISESVPTPERAYQDTAYSADLKNAHQAYGISSLDTASMLVRADRLAGIRFASRSGRIYSLAQQVKGGKLEPSTRRPTLQLIASIMSALAEFERDLGRNWRCSQAETIYDLKPLQLPFALSRRFLKHTPLSKKARESLRTYNTNPGRNVLEHAGFLCRYYLRCVALKSHREPLARSPVCCARTPPQSGNRNQCAAIAWFRYWRQHVHCFRGHGVFFQPPFSA